MKKKIVLMILIIVITITALIIGFLYFATDTFKSDKELFFKYLSGIEILDKNYTQKYKEILQTEIQSNYSSSGNLICSTSANTDETNIANLQQLFSIKYNTLKNKGLNQNYADLTLNTNNQDLATIRYLRDDKLYGIKIENDGYIESNDWDEIDNLDDIDIDALYDYYKNEFNNSVDESWVELL